MLLDLEGLTEAEVAQVVGCAVCHRLRPCPRSGGPPAALRMQETVKQYADGIFRTYAVAGISRLNHAMSRVRSERRSPGSCSRWTGHWRAASPHCCGCSASRRALPTARLVVMVNYRPE